MLRKIDILNFITDFRKAPNDIKTFSQLQSHLDAEEATLKAMLGELIQLRTIRQTEVDGEVAYQVVAK
ncbi:MAG: hypothetical protein AB7K37_12320 [Cyclobacteriaceae bacterium]